MAEKTRPWYKVATPQQRRELEATTWRRDIEASLFRAGNEPGDETPSAIIARSTEANRRNPLGQPPGGGDGVDPGEGELLNVGQPAGAFAPDPGEGEQSLVQQPAGGRAAAPYRYTGAFADELGWPGSQPTPAPVAPAPPARPWWEPEPRDPADPFAATADIPLARTETPETPGFGDAYAAASRASTGFFTGANPVESVRRAGRGLFEGEEFDPSQLGFVRNMEDGPLRRILTTAESWLIDPVALATLPAMPASLLTRVLISAGFLTGPAAQEATRALGGGETAQTVAAVAGSFAPFGPQVARGAGRLAARAGRAVGDALGDAPPGYVDPSRRGALRAEIIPGVGPGDDALRAADVPPAAAFPDAPVAAQPPRVPPAPPTDAVPSGDALAALRDALQSEIALRESGVPAAEIAAGRSQQAGRVAGALGRLGPDATIEQRIAASSRVAGGRQRQTFNAPLELTEAHQSELANMLEAGLADAAPQARMAGLRSLQALIAGDNVQPAQLKMLQRVFGEDVAALLGDVGKGRPSPMGVIDAAGEARIAAAGRFAEKQIAQFEERAVAQRVRGDELGRQLAMEPTNARLKRTVEEAKQRGLDAQNKADLLLVQRAEKLSPLPETATAAESLAQQKATYSAVNSLRAADAARTAGTATAEQTVLLQAREVLGRKVTVSPAMQQAQLESLDLWLKGNRVMLDKIGETTHETMRGIAARATGDLSDSYLTALYQNKAGIENALEQQGWAPALARKASQYMADAELARRYPAGVPPRLQAEIAKTVLNVGSRGNRILAGAAELSQEWKNLAFGPADMGVLGQQVLKATQAAPTQILAGTVNRLLNVMHMGIDTRLVDSVALTKRMQYALDGVPQNAMTGAVEEAREAGTLLRHVPGLGRADVRLSRWIDANTRFQFGTILGNLRNLIHEGNLVALHLTGQDISNPAVRRIAAEFANAATSYAPRALNAQRRLAEQAVLLSPSMRRAQVASILQLGRTLLPGTAPEARILGAIGIVNLAVSTLAVGKLLNDRIGVGDFEFDPSKPGFGQITTGLKNRLGQNIVTSLFPQEQVVTTIAKSLRLLAETDPAAAGLAWAKLFVSSASPVVQTGLKAAGIGYQPNRGYRFGDYSGGVVNLLPLPPVFQSYASDQLSGVQTPFELAGVSSFTESARKAVARGEYGTLAVEAQFDAVTPEAWRIAGTDQYPTYSMWRTAQEAAGLDDRAIEKTDTARAYAREKDRLQIAWVTENPQDALTKWKADEAKPFNALGRWAPTTKERAIIESKTGQGTPLGRMYETGLFDVEERAWTELKATWGGSAGAAAARFGSFAEYRDEEIKKKAVRFQSTGMDEGLALRRAEATIESVFGIEEHTKIRGRLRQEWASGNKELAKEAIAQGYLSASGANIRAVQ